MIANIIYLTAFFVFVPIIFHLLFKLKFQTLFQSNKIWEIKLAYLLLTLALAHLLASFIEKFYLISASFNV